MRKRVLQDVTKFLVAGESVDQIRTNHSTEIAEKLDAVLVELGLPLVDGVLPAAAALKHLPMLIRLSLMRWPGTVNQPDVRFLEDGHRVTLKSWGVVEQQPNKLWALSVRGRYFRARILLGE